MKALYPTQIFYPAMARGGTPCQHDHDQVADNPLEAAQLTVRYFQGAKGVKSASTGDVICLPDLGRWFVIENGGNAALREVSGNYARVWMRETGFMDRIGGIRQAVKNGVVPSPEGGRSIEVGAAAGSAAFD
jgi:hypothetical protein